MVQTNQVNQIVQNGQIDSRPQIQDYTQNNYYDPNPHYQQYDINENEINYNLQQIRQSQQSQGNVQLIERDNTQLINELQCYIRPKWLPILLDLEIELQAIAEKKAIFTIDFPNYITKRILPFLDFFLNKLFTDSRKLKVQCYFNEILLLIQKIIFIQWRQYPQICINLLRKIFPFQEPRFFDSHFNEAQFYQAIQNFYAERHLAGITSEHQGKHRKSQQDPLQQVVFYPIEGEILSQFQKDKASIHLSPLLRIQIHYFYKNGGIGLLIDGINHFQLQNFEILEILNHFSTYFDRQLYMNYFCGVRDQLVVLYQKINEEDIKLSTKDQVKRFIETLEKALTPFYNQYNYNSNYNQVNFMEEIKEIVTKSELQIYLQCFRCHIFEKRIFGLQQICDKISSLDIMDYYLNTDFRQKDDNIQKDILIQFLVKNKIFQELFGEKAHFELIKRSCPLIRFLYKNNQIHQNEIILIVKMGKGKHESWSGFLFKILNDIAEIMSESDMEAVLSEIQEHKVDINILNFIKCMGRNQNFDKKLFQQKKEVKENILTELEQEQEQESVQNIPKGEKLTIKIYSEEQQYSEDQYLISRNQDKKMIQQQQKQEVCRNRIINNDDSIDTNYEEGEGIRGRIVEYLLNVSSENSNIDISSQALKIALELICYQFRFLRMKYLNLAFKKLLENDQQTENHTQMITKILTSQYPIDNYASQQELIKAIEQKYSFKMSLLAVIGKTKKRAYEKNRDFYTEQIDSLLKFYQFLYLLTENKIEASHLRLLWQLLVENALSQKEWDLFFRWIISQNKNAISLDALQMLFFDYLIKIDYNSFTVPMFDCLQYLIVYFNVQYKILKTDIMDQYLITDSEIVGLDILWKLFFATNNKDVIQKVQQFLLQLTNYKSQNQQILNKLKQNYIEQIFENIQIKNKTERCLELCLKLLEEVEGMKYLQQDSFEKEASNGQNMLIIVDNRCKNAQNPKRQEISVPENSKIIVIKQIIGQKLNPQIKKGDFDLVCRGNWLDNQKTLKDYKFDKKPTFQVLMRQTQGGSDYFKNDESKPLAICCGDFSDQMNEHPKPTKLLKVVPIVPQNSIPTGLPVLQQLSSQQQEKIQNVIDVSNEFNKDFVEFVLKENNWNEEQAIMDIIENKEFYFKKYEDKHTKSQGFPLVNNRQYQSFNDNLQQNPQIPQFAEQSRQIIPAAEYNQFTDQSNKIIPAEFQQFPEQSRQIIPAAEYQQFAVERFNIATLISENNNYIQKLFDTLNEGEENQNSRVWQILSMIPRNKETYDLIEQCQQNEEWESLLDLSNKYKLYYNLQILKELLDCDFIDDAEELKRRESCRDNFLTQGGLLQILQLFFLPNVDPNTVQLALDIFLIYFTAFIQAKFETNDEFCCKVINLKETVRNQFKLFEEKTTSNLFFKENEYDKSKQKSDTGSNSQSSGVSTPKFTQAQLTPPITPPPEESIPFTKPQQQMQGDNVDEKQLLIAKFKANLFSQEFMNWPYEDLMISLINKLEFGYEQIFQTILLILYFNPQLGNTLYEIEDFTKLIFNVLTKCQKQESRRLLTYSLIQICKLQQDQDQGDFGVYLLKEMLPKTINPQTEYEDIFILTAVILKGLNINKIQGIFDFSQMSLEIIQKIIDRPIIEERFEDNEDKVVQGYLILLAAIIEICPQTKESLSTQMIKQIYEFLFHLDDDYEKYPKFKRKLTRKRAFQFLLEASKNCEKNYLLLLDPISNTHGKFEQVEQDFDTGVKGHYGFVGLKNLGATCYINSLLQQFFMNQTFRHGILNSQLKIQENNQLLVFDDSDQIKDQQIKLRLQEHTLYQLQLVFIQLQHSVKSFINPMQFIKTLQGYDGLPINFQVQSDVNEFFNLLTDKLEKDQKGTEQQELITQVMGGALGHEIRSLEQDVEFQRETDEVFLTVTIEIKNKKNLEESLDLFIKADVLDGENKYFCEEINRRIDVEKRCYFKKLPNTFIFTLKRFEFDYNRMLKLKVNDYFEFPSEINMFKWTKDNLINNLQLDDYTDYIYKLVGVLVHTGSADSGHYYSFINTQDNKWFEFNDKLVTPFKFENLKAECFGGNYQQNDNFNMYDWDTNKSKNAYLLFYEKIDKQDIQIKGTNEKLLQSKIIQENIDYLRNQLFFSTDYQGFVREFVCQFNFAEHQIEQVENVDNLDVEQQQQSHIIQENSQFKVVKLFTLFSLETLQKNKDQIEFTNSIQVLCALYEKVPQASFWFLTHLQSNLSLLINHLIESNVSEIKSAFSKLLILSIQTVIRQEEQFVQLNTKFEQQNLLIFQFLQFYIENLLPICKKQLRRASEFFQILKLSVQTSNIVIEYLYRKGFMIQIYRLFRDTIVENSSYGNYMNITKLNDKNLEATSSAMCELICKTILGAQTNGMNASNEKSQTYLFYDKQISIKIDQQILSDLRDYGDYKKVFVPMVQLNSIIVDMTKHLCFYDISTSEMLIEQLVNTLLEWNLYWQQIDPIFHILEKVLKIQDPFEEMRIQALMDTQIRDTTFIKGKSIMDAINSQFQSDKNYCYCLSSWIAEISFNSKVVQCYFNNNKPLIDNIYNKLKKYKENTFFLNFPISKITKAIEQLTQIFYKEASESEEELLKNNSSEGQEMGVMVQKKSIDNTSPSEMDDSQDNQAKIFCFEEQTEEEEKQKDDYYP